MSLDRRWEDGMNGWRVRVVEAAPEHLREREGEVTGFSHGGSFVYVVLDDREEPIMFRWYEVRPA